MDHSTEHLMIKDLIKKSIKDLFSSYVETQNSSPKILQITDMQLIDSSQRRVPDRLSQIEVDKWIPENVDVNCLDQIRTLITKTTPDLIVITGDLVYGEFDDSGRIQKMFFEFMDSFNIPWLPIFGNHDNESAIGVDAQCKLLESLHNCKFKRGNVTGAGNYSVGLFSDGKLYRAFYMLDSHGCGLGYEESSRLPAHLAKDQLDFVETTIDSVRKLTGYDVPNLIAYHIPDTTFDEIATKKGYIGKGFGEIGRDFTSFDGDHGKLFEPTCAMPAPEGYKDFLKRNNIDTILYGHDHKNNAVVTDPETGVRYIYGTKTGTYDYHADDMLGGTLLYGGTSPVIAEHIYLNK